MAVTEPIPFEETVVPWKNICEEALVRVPLSLNENQFLTLGESAWARVGGVIGYQIGVGSVNEGLELTGDLAEINGSGQH